MKKTFISAFIGIGFLLSSFSLVQASPVVDLTIAGSNGPVHVKKGDTIAIIWNSENSSYCTGSGLGWNGQIYGQWGQKSLPTSGSEFFSPVDNPGFSGTISFSIVCWNSNKTEMGEDTENAVIISPSEIKIVSPNGGQIFEVGKIYPILWNFNSGETKTVDIFLQYLLPGKTETPDIIISNYVNNGEYNWEVPTTLSPGDYKISIQSKEGEFAQDISDSSFKVIVPTPIIYSFSPNYAPIGSNILVNGDHFESIKNVTFIDNDSGKIYPLEYSPISETQIKVFLPNILTGKYYLNITTSFGSVKSSDVFNLLLDTSNSTGTIYASPNPCKLINSDQCLTNLVWSTQGVSAASVLLEDGRIVFNGINGNQSTRSGYVYYLYDYSKGSKGSLLGSVDVKGINENISINPVTSTPIINSLTPTSKVTSSVNPTSLFPRNMWQGVTGSDVKKLQQLLNLDISTRIVESGVGSYGQESTYFGLLTQMAVQNFQCKYDIVCSGNPDTTGYGVVGPSTRLKLEEVFGGNKNVPEESFTVNSFSPSTSSLTKSQIESILGLLNAFGADQTVVDNVKAALTN